MRHSDQWLLDESLAFQPKLAHDPVDFDRGLFAPGIEPLSVGPDFGDRHPRSRSVTGVA